MDTSIDNLIKEGIARLSEEQKEAFQPRVLTDLSGRFDTVAMETTHADMGAYMQMRQAMFAQQSAAGERSPLLDLVESGRNEYWSIEY